MHLLQGKMMDAGFESLEAAKAAARERVAEGHKFVMVADTDGGEWDMVED
jgi:hypothetical protein